MNEPVISVKNISKSYKINHELRADVGNVTFRDAIVRTLKKPKELLTGHVMKKEKFWALNDVSFDVMKGEVVGIIGKNGSGKSTLLKVMSRITEPTKGKIVMNGRVASLLEVGTGFHPELSGRENIYFNGSILGMKKKEIDAKFDEIVAFSEVEKFLDTPVKFYSSGMYVRLAFAVAAHLDPDILIVDEVLAVGDAAFQKKCLGKMKDVAGQGRTVLFVSHSMPSVKALCTKAIWLDKGKIVKVGNMEEVTDAYSSTSVTHDSNLAKRPRTSKISGEAQITSLVIKSEGQKGPLVDPTKSLNLEFTIKAKENVDNVVVHCGVINGGQTVVRFMSEFTNNAFKLKKGINKIVCKTAPSNLTGGIYTVDCSILHPGREGVGHIDEVFDATSFGVKEYPVPSGENFLTQKEASYYLENKWEIEN